MTLLTVATANHIATLTLDRPGSMNPIGHDGDGAEIEAACNAINGDTDIRVAILTGAGKAFSAGGDIKAMRDRTGNFGGNAVAVADGYRDNIHRALRALYGLRVPLIAAVNGPAIGLGCDIACLADMRIASDRAKFGVTFLKLGIIPGDGGTWILPRVIGESRAAELFYTGDVIGAEQACEWGLVGRVVPHERLMDEAQTLAAKIAAMPPLALRQAKNLLRQGRSIGYDTALELAANTQALMHHTEDHAEGVAALLEKRAPEFRANSSPVLARSRLWPIVHCKRGLRDGWFGGISGMDLRDTVRAGWAGMAGRHDRLGHDPKRKPAQDAQRIARRHAGRRDRILCGTYDVPDGIRSGDRRRACRYRAVSGRSAGVARRRYAGRHYAGRECNSVRRTGFRTA